MNQPKTKREAQQEIARLVSSQAAEERCAAQCQPASRQRARHLLRADNRKSEAARLRALLPTLPE
jgi:hypothetical protein